MTAEDGSLEDAITELRALAEMLLEKIEPWLRAEATPTAVGSDCGWCPLCALAAALRGQRPELTRRVAEQGAGWLTAVRTLLESHDSTCSAQRPSSEAESAPTARVQRISVRSTGACR